MEEVRRYLTEKNATKDYLLSMLKGKVKANKREKQEVLINKVANLPGITLDSILGKVVGPSRGRQVVKP